MEDKSFFCPYCGYTGHIVEKVTVHSVDVPTGNHEDIVESIGYRCKSCHTELSGDLNKYLVTVCHQSVCHQNDRFIMAKDVVNVISYIKKLESENATVR